jgi:hypothetical protein
MLRLGGFAENVDWLKFIAIAAGHLTNVSLTNQQYPTFTVGVSNYTAC